MVEKIEWEQMFSGAEIARRVMEYHAGCKEGKREFLRDQFGITEIPRVTKTQDITVTITMSQDDTDLSPDTFARVLANGFIAEQKDYHESYGNSSGGWWKQYTPLGFVVRGDDEEFSFELNEDNILSFNRYDTP